MSKLTDFERQAAQAGNFALVTGASSGIGLELAKIAGSRGFNLVLVSRNQENLEQAKASIATLSKEQTVMTLAANLEFAEERQKIADRLQAQNIKIALLVNCAGFTAHGRFRDSDINKQESVLNINALAPMSLTMLLLPSMLELKEAKILNVASTAAFRPSPFQAVYYAAKSFMLSFSQGLEEELRGTNVTVTCLCPGATETNFFSRAKIKVPAMAQSSLMSPRAVARAGYAGMLKGKSIVIPGLRNKIQAHVVRLLPRRVVLWIMSKVMTPVEKSD